MTDWFTSDLHLNHQAIIDYVGRPFRNVEHMNTYLIDAWRGVVKPEDTVYFLGDFALYADRVMVKAFRDQLPGRIVFVRGNHDRSRTFLLSCGFDEVVNDTYVESGGHQLYLSHRPQSEELWSPFADYHIVGHVHEKWRRHRNIINVGVDVWDFRPVSLEQVLACKED